MKEVMNWEGLDIDVELDGGIAIVTVDLVRIDEADGRYVVSVPDEDVTVTGEAYDGRSLGEVVRRGIRLLDGSRDAEPYTAETFSTEAEARGYVTGNYDRDASLEAMKQECYRLIDRLDFDDPEKEKEYFREESGL